MLGVYTVLTVSHSARFNTVAYTQTDSPEAAPGRARSLMTTAAVLARVIAMALCLSVCLSVSVTSRCSIERDGWIELIFGMESSFHLFHTVL